MALHPRLQWLLWNGLLLAAGVVIAIQGVRLIAAIQAGAATTSDFCLDYQTARHWMGGARVYTPVTCWSRFSSTPQPLEYDTHLPPSLLLLDPFALLPYELASWLWGLFSLVCLVLSLLIICRELGLWRTRSVLPIVALFLLWDPTMESTRAGNVGGGITCLLIALSWRALRRGQQEQAGILAGLAIALKPFPFLLLLCFLLSKQWRAALSSTATLLLSSLVSLAFIGPGAWLDYLGPVRVNEDSVIPVPGNLSLEGWLTRWIAGYHEFLHPGVGRAFIDLSPLVSGLSLQTALLLGDLLAGLVILLISRRLWKRTFETGWDERDDASFAAILVLSFLVFPLAWHWNLVLLAMPLLWLTVALIRQPRSRVRWLFGGALILLAMPFSVIALAFQLQEQSTPPLPVRLAGLALTTMPTIALILLLLALRPWLKREARRPAKPPVSEPSFDAPGMGKASSEQKMLP